jgi:hypothetical protein
VLRLVDAGESFRAVAVAVFGAEGAKNRVARIVRRRAEQLLEKELAEAGLPLVDEGLPLEERHAELERISGNVELVRRLNDATRE